MYDEMLRNKHDHWRQACIDRGLDPEQELEQELRRSLHRERARRNPYVERPTWISKIVRSLLL